MTDEQMDQVNAYGEYYKSIKEFNSANEEYLHAVGEIANNRKNAIQKAIEVHISPVVSRLRTIQTISVIVLVICVITFCVTSIYLYTLIENQQTTTGAVLGGSVGVIVVLCAIAIGIIALILLLWTSSRISTLNSNIQKAQAKANNPFAE